jgi:hypothetical protein
MPELTEKDGDAWETEEGDGSGKSVTTFNLRTVQLCEVGAT